MNKTSLPTDYKTLGKKYRRDIIHMAVSGGRGHLGAAFSLVEIIAVLFERILSFKPKEPHWKERDRIILSKGHGCMALYAALASKGFFSAAEFELFCKKDGILGGHPDHRLIPGIEHSTGSLGHGLSVGIGMAIAGKVDQLMYRVFVILGDGECNEGSVWEAALHANKHHLDNLVVLVDYNKMQSFGIARDILDMEPFADKWNAFGFETKEVDMNAPEELEKLLLQVPLKEGRPTAIICHTTKGKGVSFMENNASWHHKNKLTEEEIRGLTEELKD